MRRVVLGALVVVAGACTGEVTRGGGPEMGEESDTGSETGGDTGAEDGSRPPSDVPIGSGVRFAAPRPGAVFPREAGTNPWGELVAAVAVDVLASDDVVAVEVVDEAGRVLADREGTRLEAEIDLVAEGPRTLTAIALDEAGDELARASVAIEVAAPAVETCFEWLDLYALDYEPGPDRPGIEQPVRVTPPIGGIEYRYVTADAPRTSMLMDCGLALALLRTAPSLHARDIVEVADIGIYNYRCIGNEGTPPDCPRGMSQHAFANAIDIAGYSDAAGLFYSVNDDWVIDGDGEATCEAATEPGADALLHELICEQKRDGIWNIVLTPNYNAGHRNHFHVDLKDGSDYIELWGELPAVDEGGPAH